jgi:hypothetical protein
MPVTFVIDYTIDPSKIAEFETYSARWIELVEREGGVHHGYYLPSPTGCAPTPAAFCVGTAP